MSAPRLTVLLLLALAAFSAGCATKSGAEKRIEKNPQLYGKLSDRDRELVRNGEVKEGMSQEAAFLAWGRPDRVMSGGRDGKSSEKWAYFDSQPVSNFSVGIGAGASLGREWALGHRLTARPSTRARVLAAKAWVRGTGRRQSCAPDWVRRAMGGVSCRRWPLMRILGLPRECSAGL